MATPEPGRRRGRPAKPGGPDPILNARVPREVQNAARAAAKRRGERFAAVVTRLLAEYAAE